MTTLIQLEMINLAYGLDPLLDGANLQIAAGERVCLIGRNGTGKSSLLKVIAGVQLPDSGKIWRKPGLRIARLAQDLPQAESMTVYDFVANGLAEVGTLLADYHKLTLKLTQHALVKDMNKLEKLQQEIDAQDGWKYEQTINAVLTKLQLDGDQPVAKLSGGWQRRAALAQALVASPELLLLDEPTNHLDVDAIQWLENQLLSSNIGLLFITHDRSFLKKLATRILELDRGKLTSWPGNYANYLRHKEELLQAEARQQAVFDKKLAQEEQWIRQGIKARRTRNEGRVRALESMRLERKKRREIEGKPSFELNAANTSGELVVEIKNVTHGYGEKTLIKDFSLRIMRGDRLGLIGKNGMGKTTLLNILLGKLKPDAGQVKTGTKLQIAYFDQLRASLDLEKTVFDNLAQGSDSIELNGKKCHIISYLGNFLFTPQRVLTPVKALSGGECNRLVLARLFSQPANVLVLDEPTNDLDIDSLELLEELLANFNGTLLLVSHDREFLDNVITSTLVFEGDGKIQEYIGGYGDWVRQVTPAVTEKIAKPMKTAKQDTKFKINNKEIKELAELPEKIGQLEAEQNKLHLQMTAEGFYLNQADTVKQVLARLAALDLDLQSHYARWELLDKKNDS